MLQLRPITRAEADAFIREHHRHHGAPVGALWRQAVHDDAGRLVGVAVVGRPVARALDDGLTVEVTRSAPHHLIADSALAGGTFAVRRTRSGDAWVTRERARLGGGDDDHGHGHGGGTPAGPVVLGLPSVRA